ncbi:MAG: GatB/YqeY domain-containing protein [Xanthomonadales bacterium]|nr:GatB/YqeY domain-containing protein [Xanthomonadales bacterium]
MADIKERLQADMKSAMKAREKDRLGTIRMALAEIKQREVDGQKALDEATEVAILDKMVKQRRESAEQYDQGGRDDLAEKERAEIEVLKQYLPTPMTAEEIEAAVAEAIDSAGAESIRDMGKVMGLLRPRVQGRVDMQEVSTLVRSKLSA